MAPADPAALHHRASFCSFGFSIIKQPLIQKKQGIYPATKKFARNRANAAISFCYTAPPRSSKRAGVAQLVEQLICNQQVAGSTPVASSIILVQIPP